MVPPICHDPSQSSQRQRILGIDPGLGIVGFGMMDVDLSEDRFLNAQWGVIRTDKHKSDSQRLQELYHDLTALVSQWQPDVAAIEKIFFFKNAKTLVPVSQARGVILLILEQYGIPIYEYTPMQVKQTITGYGKADKREVQNMLMQVFGLAQIPRPDDAADALAMAYCQYQMHGRFQAALQT